MFPVDPARDRAVYTLYNTSNDTGKYIGREKRRVYVLMELMYWMTRRYR